MKPMLRTAMVGVVVALILVVPATADPVYFDTANVVVGSGGNTGTFVIPGFGQIGGVLLQYNLTLSGSSGGTYDGKHVAFCVENAQSGNMSGYLWDLASLSSQQLYYASWLLETYFTPASTARQRELLQVAVWEIVFDPFGSWNLTAGNFQHVSGLTSTEVTQIGTWLAAIPAQVYSNAYVLVSDERTDPTLTAGKQDFLIRRVPEPGSLILLGIGLFGLGVLRRKS